MSLHDYLMLEISMIFLAVMNIKYAYFDIWIVCTEKILDISN